MLILYSRLAGSKDEGWPWEGLEVGGEDRQATANSEPEGLEPAVSVALDKETPDSKQGKPAAHSPLARLPTGLFPFSCPPQNSWASGLAGSFSRTEAQHAKRSTAASEGPHPRPRPNPGTDFPFSLLLRRGKSSSWPREEETVKYLFLKTIITLVFQNVSLNLDNP